MTYNEKESYQILELCHHRIYAVGLGHVLKFFQGDVRLLVWWSFVVHFSENTAFTKWTLLFPVGGITLNQGCDCAANWLILANSDPNFVISEISVNQVRKCLPARGLGYLCCYGSL